MSKTLVTEFPLDGGLTARIYRIDSDFPTGPSWLCGYVKVPEDHVLHDPNLNPCGPELSRLHVHGGVSFQGELDDTEGLWIGFDCSHGQDDPRFGGTPKDVDYVWTECVSLGQQLVAMIPRRHRFFKRLIYILVLFTLPIWLIPFVLYVAIYYVITGHDLDPTTPLTSLRSWADR